MVIVGLSGFVEGVWMTTTDSPGNGRGHPAEECGHLARQVEWDLLRQVKIRLRHSGTEGRERGKGNHPRLAFPP